MKRCRSRGASYETRERKDSPLVNIRNSIECKLLSLDEVVGSELLLGNESLELVAKRKGCWVAVEEIDDPEEAVTGSNWIGKAGTIVEDVVLGF